MILNIQEWILILKMQQELKKLEQEAIEAAKNPEIVAAALEA